MENSTKMVVQCSGGAGDFPSLAAPLSGSDLGFVGGERRLSVNLVLRAGGPHLVFIAQCDRDPPAIDGLGASDQGAGQGPIIGGRSLQHFDHDTIIKHLSCMHPAHMIHHIC